MSTAPNSAVRLYLAEQGRKGGTSGKGDAKGRGDSSHYRRMAEKRWHVSRWREAILFSLTLRERKVYLLGELRRVE